MLPIYHFDIDPVTRSYLPCKVWGCFDRCAIDTPGESQGYANTLKEGREYLRANGSHANERMPEGKEWKRMPSASVAEAQGESTNGRQKRTLTNGGEKKAQAKPTGKTTGRCVGSREGKQIRERPRKAFYFFPQGLKKQY